MPGCPVGSGKRLVGCELEELLLFFPVSSSFLFSFSFGPLPHMKNALYTANVLNRELIYA